MPSTMSPGALESMPASAQQAMDYGVNGLVIDAAEAPKGSINATPHHFGGAMAAASSPVIAGVAMASCAALIYAAQRRQGARDQGREGARVVMVAMYDDEAVPMAPSAE